MLRWLLRRGWKLTQARGSQSSQTWGKKKSFIEVWLTSISFWLIIGTSSLRQSGNLEDGKLWFPGLPLPRLYPHQVQGLPHPLLRPAQS